MEKTGSRYQELGISVRCAVAGHVLQPSRVLERKHNDREERARIVAGLTKSCVRAFASTGLVRSPENVALLHWTIDQNRRHTALVDATDTS